MVESPESTNRRHIRPAAQWAILTVLSATALLLAAELFFAPRPAVAQSSGPQAPPADVFAVAGQITRDTYGLYLVDRRSGTICLYEYLAGQKVLRLRAARTFTFDLQLDELNTAPSPADIARLVGRARRLKDVTSEPRP